MDNCIGKFDVQGVETHISKNLDELLILLRCLEANFHCILYNTKLYSIPGYNLIYNRGGTNKNNGVIIYVKSNLQYSYEGVVNMLNTSKSLI
nr:unnamed protein product [Callosobruchus chinensis]